MLAFICAVALVRDLGAPDTPIQTIENLRFNTRSPSGWILLVVLIALPLEIIILIARFLNFPIVNKYSVIFLVVVSLAWAWHCHLHSLLCSMYIYSV